MFARDSFGFPSTFSLSLSLRILPGLATIAATYPPWIIIPQNRAGQRRESERNAHMNIHSDLEKEQKEKKKEKPDTANTVTNMAYWRVVNTFSLNGEVKFHNEH